MRSTWLLPLLLACGTDPPTEEAFFPADYAATYQEVRNCRNSIDHDLMRIRIVASPSAMQPYAMRNAPFPTGAILLKEQFEGDDFNCEGPIVSITAMQKLDEGTDPASLDWAWQKTSPSFEVDAELDTQLRCANCHATGCAQEGYLGTCASP